MFSQLRWGSIPGYCRRVSPGPLPERIPADHHHGHSPFSRLLGIFRHGDHHHDRPLPAGEAGIRATKVSLIGLTITALAQGLIVVFSGSVALLSDTVHNAADALTAVPLWIAFVVGRRPPDRRFTHGYNRAEDLAGLMIILVIAASAVVVGWESARRLFDPREIDHAGWVIAAGVIGAFGNEIVARYRIRIGRRIGSEALVADGHHARTDALTSLAVVVAGIGSLAGVIWVDPAAGLTVALLIVLMLRRSGARVLGRVLDAVDPDLVEVARHVIGATTGVEEVTDLRVRWHGHRLDTIVSISVGPDLTVRQGHEIAQQVSHDLMHAFPYRITAVVHVDPHGVDDSHALIEHHLEEL